MKLLKVKFVFFSNCSEHLNGLTPLMEASAAGHTITVQFFLQHVSLLALLVYKSLCAIIYDDVQRPFLDENYGGIDLKRFVMCSKSP